MCWWIILTYLRVQVSGALYYSNALALQRFLSVPQWLARCSSQLLEPVFSGTEPQAEAPLGMGATLDIQRQQRMDMLDQQLLLSQLAQLRRNAQQPPPQQVRPTYNPWFEELTPIMYILQTKTKHTPVHLLVRGITWSASHVMAEQCIKTCRYGPTAWNNVYIILRKWRENEIWAVLLADRLVRVSLWPLIFWDFSRAYS